MILTDAIKDFVEKKKFDLNTAATLEPLIKYFLEGSQFEDKYTINSHLKQTHLNFYFLSNDFNEIFSLFRNNCVYFRYTNFDIIIYDVNFIGNWKNALPEKFKQYIDTESDFKDPNASQKVPLEALENANNLLSMYSNDFFIQWILAHEIGHAFLGHHPGHFYALNNGSIKPCKLSKEKEKKADLFAIYHMLNDHHTRYMFWMTMTQMISRWLLIETGKGYYGYSSQKEPIIIKDVSSTHPPLVVRILDMVILLLKIDPSLDQTDYFERIRSRIQLK